MWKWLLSNRWSEETHGQRAEQLATMSTHTQTAETPWCGVQSVSQTLICDSLSSEIYPGLKFKSLLSLCGHIFEERCMTDQFSGKKSRLLHLRQRVMTGASLCPRVKPRRSRAEKATIRADCESSKCPLIAHPLFAEPSLIGALFMRLGQLMFSYFKPWLIHPDWANPLKRLGGNWCLLSRHSSLICPMLVLH